MQKHIMERKRNINSVIHDQLLGRLSEEERKRLQVWMKVLWKIKRTMNV